ncbi:hypothetical protein MHK_008516 [Candidatus Magnetomorum sp. HK-1]|nr:hypothetical protein MHK_008516 [Candidatus Magnetomorum sp. HK-1]
MDCEEHFFVERESLIENCTNQLIGNPSKGGHYFTIWAPRQTGKTWIIRQCAEIIKSTYKDSFIVADLSMQAFTPSETENQRIIFFRRWHSVILGKLNIDVGPLENWDNWLDFFKKRAGILKKPLILIIDEFDKLPPEIIDQVVSMFRDMYLTRDEYMLHGLAFVGVRAVLGVDSKKGSPFNVQRSVHIPNLTFAEVQKMFDNYQIESGQKVDPQVVQQLYETTNGQPGLIGWFGELLSEKYNRFQDKPINMDLWNEVYAASVHIEHNNTIQNMIVKAKNEYKTEVLKLFKDANIDFSFNVDWCNYMCMHGLITYEKIRQLNEIKYVCRFSSPYVQSCLYAVFTGEVAKNQSGQVMALNPLDFLEDIFDPPGLNIPALLNRYKDYLKRLKDNGENPWANQPRRKTDFHLTEAVGHFHLYFWLKMAIDSVCSIIPEFPTGNGKVDLHIKCKKDKKGLIEVKSFVNPLKVNEAMIQASEYAVKTSYSEITIALFAPFTDENVLNQISKSKTISNVIVNIVAIGQG